MKIDEGYYWVKITPEGIWRIMYWSGLIDHFLHHEIAYRKEEISIIHPERIFRPDEQGRNNSKKL